MWIHSKFFRAIYENYGYSLKALWIVWESIRERNYRLKKKRIIYLGLVVKAEAYKTGDLYLQLLQTSIFSCNLFIIMFSTLRAVGCL